VAGAIEWVAVDWGTSNLRAWGIDSAGDVVFAVSSDQGMGKLTRDAYPSVLSALIAPHVGDAAIDVLICGMAGARQGWMEAPYLETPAVFSGFMAGAVRPETAGTKFAPQILPGICQRAAGREDVMRGEETQLLGLMALKTGFEGTVIMPGTHSKWVRVADGRITEFATAMTGELYDVLGTRSVLRHSLAGEHMGPATEDGVAEGLAAGLGQPEMLSSTLFRTRAAALLGGRGADWCAGYLSGLLVGSEIGGLRGWLGEAPVPLIGSARLARLYGAGLARIGLESEAIDATEVTLAGLKAARAQEKT
jgi:2-dehydro-3-deoxygalactonokinase